MGCYVRKERRRQNFKECSSVIVNFNCQFNWTSNHWWARLLARSVRGYLQNLTEERRSAWNVDSTIRLVGVPDKIKKTSLAEHWYSSLFLFPD